MAPGKRKAKEQMAPRKRKAKEQKTESETNPLVVHHHIIDEVMESVRDDFLVEGVGESALQELRQLWESNMVMKYCMTASYEEGGKEAEPRHAPTPVTMDCLTLATGDLKQTDLATCSHMSVNAVLCLGGPGDVTPLSVFEGNQGDGECSFRNLGEVSSNPTLVRLEPSDIDTRMASLAGGVSPRGPSYILHDHGYHDSLQEHYNEPGDDEPQTAVEGEPEVLEVEPARGDSDRKPSLKDCNRAPPLDESNLEDIDVDDLAKQPQTENFILAQFEKVTRKKSKWKCVLKNFVMPLNNRDIFFAEAKGEFEF